MIRYEKAFVDEWGKADIVYISHDDKTKKEFRRWFCKCRNEDSEFLLEVLNEEIYSFR